MRSIAQDGYNGPYYQHLLARIYTVAGEPEKDALADPAVRSGARIGAGRGESR